MNKAGGRVTRLTPPPEGLLVAASDGFLGLLVRANGSTLWTAEALEDLPGKLGLFLAAASRQLENRA